MSHADKVRKEKQAPKSTGDIASNLVEQVFGEKKSNLSVSDDLKDDYARLVVDQTFRLMFSHNQESGEVSYEALFENLVKKYNGDKDMASYVYVNTIASLDNTLVATPHPTWVLGKDAKHAERALNKFMRVNYSDIENNTLSAEKTAELKKVAQEFKDTIEKPQKATTKQERGNSAWFASKIKDASNIQFTRMMDPLQKNGYDIDRLSQVFADKEPDLGSTERARSSILKRTAGRIKSKTWAPGDADGKPLATPESLEAGIQENHLSIFEEYAVSLQEAIFEKSFESPDQRLFELLDRVLMTISDHKKLEAFLDVHLENFQHPEAEKIKGALLGRSLDLNVEGKGDKQPINADELKAELENVMESEHGLAGLKKDSNGLTAVGRLYRTVNDFGDYAQKPEYRQSSEVYNHTYETVVKLLEKGFDEPFKEGLKSTEFYELTQGEKGKEYIDSIKNFALAPKYKLDGNSYTLAELEKLGDKISEDLEKPHIEIERKSELSNLYNQMESIVNQVSDPESAEYNAEFKYEFDGEMYNLDGLREVRTDLIKEYNEAAEQFGKEDSRTSEIAEKHTAIQNQILDIETLRTLDVVARYPEAVETCKIAECGSGKDLIIVGSLLEAMTPENMKGQKTAVPMPLVEYPDDLTKLDNIILEAMDNPHFKAYIEENAPTVDFFDPETGKTRPMTIEDAIRFNTPELNDEERNQLLEDYKDKLIDPVKAIDPMDAGSDSLKSGSQATIYRTNNSRTRLQVGLLEHGLVSVNYKGTGSGHHRASITLAQVRTRQGIELRVPGESLAMQNEQNQVHRAFQIHGFETEYSKKVDDYNELYSNVLDNIPEGKADRLVKSLKGQREELATIALSNVNNTLRLKDEGLSDEQIDSMIDNYINDLYNTESFDRLVDIATPRKMEGENSFAARPAERIRASLAAFGVGDLRAIGYGAVLNNSGNGSPHLYYGLSDAINSAGPDGIIPEEKLDNAVHQYLTNPTVQSMMNRAMFSLTYSDFDQSWEFMKSGAGLSDDIQRVVENGEVSLQKGDIKLSIQDIAQGNVDQELSELLGNGDELETVKTLAKLDSESSRNLVAMNQVLARVTGKEIEMSNELHDPQTLIDSIAEFHPELAKERQEITDKVKKARDVILDGFKYEKAEGNLKNALKEELAEKYFGDAEMSHENFSARFKAEPSFFAHAIMKQSFERVESSHLVGTEVNLSQSQEQTAQHGLSAA